MVRGIICVLIRIPNIVSFYVNFSLLRLNPSFVSVYQTTPRVLSMTVSEYLENFDAVEAQNAKSMLQSAVGQVAFYGS